MFFATGMIVELIFLSTSSARRTTHAVLVGFRVQIISIHVLREEDDFKRRVGGERVDISIHVLREEDDRDAPLARGRPSKFLSTSSARRTTLVLDVRSLQLHISIHVLREEDDNDFRLRFSHFRYFYPRPPRGGRRNLHILRRVGRVFLSTSSARRTTVAPDILQHLVDISIHVLREEDDRSPRHPAASGRYFYPRPPRGGRP